MIHTIIEIREILNERLGLNTSTTEDIRFRDYENGDSYICAQSTQTLSDPENGWSVTRVGYGLVGEDLEYSETSGNYMRLDSSQLGRILAHNNNLQNEVVDENDNPINTDVTGLFLHENHPFREFRNRNTLAHYLTRNREYRTEDVQECFIQDEHGLRLGEYIGKELLLRINSNNRLRNRFTQDELGENYLINNPLRMALLGYEISRTLREN